MLVNYSDEPVSLVKPSIFLAGPTPRDINHESWRNEALANLVSLNFEGVVYVPERNFDDRTFDYVNQVDWEKTALTAAGVIVFWVPRQLPHMPGFTTNVEFGYWLAKNKGKVLYGRPENAAKVTYLDWLYRSETNNEPFTDLYALLSDACHRL